MSAEANRALLKSVYEAVSRGDPRPLLAAMHDDIVWTIIGTTALSGTSRGKQAVIDNLLVPLRARLGDGPIVFAPERFIAEGEFVVMQAKGSATARSGAPYENTYCIVARIVDGKIREMTDYVDTELITSVLGN